MDVQGKRTYGYYVNFCWLRESNNLESRLCLGWMALETAQGPRASEEQLSKIGGMPLCLLLYPFLKFGLNMLFFQQHGNPRINRQHFWAPAHKEAIISAGLYLVEQ